jgi:hypothetical protein
VTGANGDLLVERRQEISVADMSAQLAAANLEISTLKSSVAAMSADGSPLMAGVLAGVQAVSADMASRTMSIATAAAANTAAVSSMTATVEALRSTQAAEAQSLQRAVASQLTAAANSVDATVSQLNTSLRSAVDTAITDSLTQTTAAITAMNSTVTTVRAGLASKKDNRLYMWTGGCRSSHGGGWGEYCLNQVQVDTARPKFEKQTNTRFRALVTGIYSVTFSVIKHTCNWAYMRIEVNGNHQIHTNQWAPNGHWNDQIADAPGLLIPAGQQMWGRSYGSCWNAWHGFSGGHSRITVIFLGNRT